MVVVIDVDIDIVVPAAMVAVIPVIVVMIVIIPVDAAEQRRWWLPEAETEAVDEAVGKLFTRRWRQIDRRVGGVGQVP
jgi:hypothetical protein